MLGRFLYFIAIVVFISLFPAATTLSGETGSIRATAYVLPAVGFETNSNQLTIIDNEPDWLMRCPSSGSLILQIETISSTVNYSYSRDKNGRIKLPDEIQHDSSDSCLITLIYSENR